MMHTTEARVKGLYKDHIVKLEPVVYSGAMEISANQGHISGLVSSVKRALASKLRGPGFKSWPGTVGGPVTIIM